MSPRGGRLARRRQYRCRAPVRAALGTPMSEAWIREDDARRAQRAGEAADWLVRLQAADLNEAQALEFDAWLSAHPANPGAYDAALSVMLELDAASAEVLGELQQTRARRPAMVRRGWIVAGGLAAAATVALAVMPFGALEPAAQSFATAKGEHRTVRLADG